MPERDHDDLAAALEGLHSGEHPSEAPAGSGQDDHVQGLGTPTQAQPQALRPAMPSPTPRPVARPTVRSAPMPAPADAPPEPPPAPRPARPMEPPVPVASADEAARLAHEREVQQQAAALQGQLSDDDAVAAPAVSLDYLARHPHGRAVRREPYFQSIGFKQTVIPVLLTLGVALPVVGLLKFAADEYSVIAQLPVWVPLVLIAAGLVLLGLAALNMMQVKHQLDAKRDVARR